MEIFFTLFPTTNIFWYKFYVTLQSCRSEKRFQEKRGKSCFKLCFICTNLFLLLETKWNVLTLVKIILPLFYASNETRPERKLKVKSDSLAQFRFSSEATSDFKSSLENSLNYFCECLKCSIPQYVLQVVLLYCKKPRTLYKVESPSDGTR